MKVRFFSLKQDGKVQGGEEINPDLLFKTAVDLVSESSKQVIQYISSRMIYIDFSEAIFYNLYIGKGLDCNLLC